MDDCWVDTSTDGTIEVIWNGTKASTSELIIDSVEPESPEGLCRQLCHDDPSNHVIPTPWTQEVESISQRVLMSGDAILNGPTIIDSDTIGNEYGALGYFNAPCAFMSFDNPMSDKKPVIFDTGASLAITYDKSDFDGPLTIPKEDLRLGGMANGLCIEGVGPVTWTFSNGAKSNVCVTSMAYYVPKAKARQLSPQRLFDSSTGVQGRFEGDHV